MGDDPNKLDSFERAYAILKHDDMLPLAESSIAEKNDIIADFLSRRFNHNATIPADHRGRETFFSSYKEIDIEETIIKENLENLDDFNSDEALENKTNKAHAINKAIENTAALNGLDLRTAKEIENGEITEAKLKEQFPLADPNIVKAASYTLLNTEYAAENNGQTDENQRDMAIAHLNYAQKDNPEYDQWIKSKQSEIAKSITQSPEIMRDLKALKCPQNIETTEQLEEQFTVRQRLTENVAEIYTKAFGVNDTFNKNDAHIIFKSREDMLKDPALAHLSSFLPGIVNDETLTYRYNPAFEMSTRNVAHAKTDPQEAESFLKSISEELQHGVDNALADKLVLGTLNQPEAEQHALSYAMNALFYFDINTESPDHSSESEHYAKTVEKYKNQYVENTAKDTAEKITNTVMTNYDKDIPAPTFTKIDTPEQSEPSGFLNKFFKP